MPQNKKIIKPQITVTRVAFRTIIEKGSVSGLKPKRDYPMMPGDNEVVEVRERFGTQTIEVTVFHNNQGTTFTRSGE